MYSLYPFAFLAGYMVWLMIKFTDDHDDVKSSKIPTNK
jgi:hypothetical protein